jgi:hypothetical protein
VVKPLGKSHTSTFHTRSADGLQARSVSSWHGSLPQGHPPDGPLRGNVGRGFLARNYRWYNGVEQPRMPVFEHLMIFFVPPDDRQRGLSVVVARNIHNDVDWLDNDQRQILVLLSSATAR